MSRQLPDWAAPLAAMVESYGCQIRPDSARHADGIEILSGDGCTMLVAITRGEHRMDVTTPLGYAGEVFDHRTRRPPAAQERAVIATAFRWAAAMT